MSGVRLILTCGLPGAGKTRLAKQIADERPAIRLSKDEWLWALGWSPWDQTQGGLIEHQLVQHTRELLAVGASVVIDFGLWARAERDELRAMAYSLGVGVELHVVDALLDELWRRIDARNASPAWTDKPISRADLDRWAAIFEAPDEREVALFEPPVQG